MSRCIHSKGNLKIAKNWLWLLLQLGFQIVNCTWKLKISINLKKNSTFLWQNCKNFSKFQEFFLLEFTLFWKLSFNNFSIRSLDFSKNNVHFFSNLWICWILRHSLEFKIALDKLFTSWKYNFETCLRCFGCLKEKENEMREMLPTV